jgi:hypothetical protein
VETKTRKLIVIHGKHLPKAGIDHLHVPRKEGGRELMKLEEANVVEITKLKEYVDSKEHPLIQTVRMYQHTTNSAMLQTAKSLERELQRGTRKIKDGVAQKPKERL